MRCAGAYYWITGCVIPPRKIFDKLHLPILCVVLRALAVCLSSEVCSTGSLVSRKLRHILMREKRVDQSYQEENTKR